MTAIENLGSADTLCINKTGTLMRGVVELGETLDEAIVERSGAGRDPDVTA